MILKITFKFPLVHFIHRIEHTYNTNIVEKYKIINASFDALHLSGSLNGLLDFVVTSDNPKKWKCAICSIFEHEKKKCVLNHLEAKHFPSAGHNCNICGAFCKTVNSLNSHKARYHKFQTSSYSDV